MIITYIYDRNNAIIGQIHNVFWFSCEIKDSEPSTGAMTINNVDLSDVFGQIKENNRISVFKQIGSEEKLLIEWYIRGFEATLTQTTIRIEDKLSILDDKVLYADYTATGSVKLLLETIIAAVNLRENMQITVDCDVFDTVTKTYKRGDTILSILNDLRNNKYQYAIKDNVLLFKNTIGIDRTTIWDTYVEYTWDILNPMERNIREAKMTADIKQMANAAVDTNWGTTYEDSASIIEYGRIERTVSSSGSGAVSAQWYVDERKNSIREFDIQPDSDNFWSCDIGDIVKVNINTGNDLMFYNGTMNVVGKRFTAGEKDKVTIVVWKWRASTVSISKIVKDLNERMKKVENRI